VTGFEAIAAHNGWSIAVVGVSIVFSGLIMLSIIISQLYKVIDLWERRGEYLEQWRGGISDRIDIPEIVVTPDMKETVRQYKLLAERLGEPFSLPKLLDLAVRCGLVNPHSTINRLLKQKVIVPDQDGYYRWHQSIAE
jgi:hypothetical protein